MRKLTQEELNKIIENHQHWLCKDCAGWENMRADLSYCDISGLDMSRAIMVCADMMCAYMSGVDMTGVDMTGAIMVGAYMVGVDMTDANMSGVDMTGAIMTSVELTDAKNIPYIPMVCPEEGAFIGYKKCQDDKIVKLCIPEDAKRSSATTRKCRCDKATVIEITNVDGTEHYDEAMSNYDFDFVYRVGEVITVDNFDDDRWKECSTGIHFFLNRQEAVLYEC